MTKGAPGKPGPGGVQAKEFPPRPTNRNLLDVDEVADRLRVDAKFVEEWLRDGVLKGSSGGVQLYELEKFRAKHHAEIQKAQSAPPVASSHRSPVSPKVDSEAGKPLPPRTPPRSAPPESPQEEVRPPSKGVVGSLFRFLGGIFSRRKPDKVDPYAAPVSEESLPPTPPRVANKGGSQGSAPPTELRVQSVQATSHLQASAIQAAAVTGELVAPPPPSSEVWPSLENLASASATPDWLNQSGEGAAVNETLIMRSDQIMAAAKAGGRVPTPTNKEIHEEKNRNQQLLQQLQEQRRAELELKDELETLKQRLELSLSSEREVRLQLKKARQELQVALEDLDQRPPAGGADPEELRRLQERESAWLSERQQWEHQKALLEQRKSSLEQQIEKLRAQAEEIRQHGLQWHQLATQQDQQLRTLRQKHAELESDAGKTLADLEQKLNDAEAARSRAEAAAHQAQQRLQAVESRLDEGQGTGSGSLAVDLQNKDKQLAALQSSLEQAQSQHRNQVQRWEQELQASASWVQKLTEAVTVRDRRIQELENQVSQAVPAARSAGPGEEELKAQVMSLRVELNSLRRNYEIVSLQAKNLENQLQENRRQQTVAASPTPPAVAPPALSLDLPAPTEEEGGFRRRLNARLKSLGAAPEEEVSRSGLEPPPFLELDIPQS